MVKRTTIFFRHHSYGMMKYNMPQVSQHWWKQMLIQKSLFSFVAVYVRMHVYKVLTPRFCLGHMNTYVYFQNHIHVYRIAFTVVHKNS